MFYSDAKIVLKFINGRNLGGFVEYFLIYTSLTPHFALSLLCSSYSVLRIASFPFVKWTFLILCPGFTSGDQIDPAKY